MDQDDLAQIIMWKNMTSLLMTLASNRIAEYSDTGPSVSYCVKFLREVEKIPAMLVR